MLARRAEEESEEGGVRRVGKTISRERGDVRAKRTPPPTPRIPCRCGWLLLGGAVVYGTWVGREGGARGGQGRGGWSDLFFFEVVIFGLGWEVSTMVRPGALSHPNPMEVCSAAKACLRLWQEGGRGTLHTQSQRFLNPAWSGLTSTDAAAGTDPSLRSFVVRLSEGESILQIYDSDPESKDVGALLHWLAAMRHASATARKVSFSRMPLCIVGASMGPGTQLRYAWLREV